MKKLSVATTVLSFFHLILCTNSENGAFCVDESDIKGRKGLQLGTGRQSESEVLYGNRSKFKPGDKIILERKGDNQCGCSFAHTDCTIDGKPCIEKVIDGNAATLNGIANYPLVDARTTLEICNYNNYAGNSVLEIGAPQNTNNGLRSMSYLRLWSSTTSGFNKDNTYDKTFYPGDDGIEEGTCKSIEQNTKLDTSVAQYYMEASIQGPLVVDTGLRESFYCMAYSFNPFDLKYDYGDPTCEFSTEAWCIVDPSENGAEDNNTLCEDYINKVIIAESSPRSFQARYEWKVCNLNDRDVFIQEGQSNRKWITNIEDSNGKRKKKGMNLGLSVMSKRSCSEFNDGDIVINPVVSNFFQIGIQGRLYNDDGDNVKYFRDKDCRSFTLTDLPKLSTDVPDGNEDICNYVISEMGDPVDAPGARFIELHSDNCGGGATIGGGVKLVSETTESSMLQSIGINLQGESFREDDFLILCNTAAAEAYGSDKCDVITDDIDTNISTKATAIVKDGAIHDIYGSFDDTALDITGLKCFCQEFSRSARDRSNALPSPVWRPQNWAVRPLAAASEGGATLEDMDLRTFKESPLHLVMNEFLNPNDLDKFGNYIDKNNQFIELFSANKKNYVIKEDIILRRSSTVNGFAQSYEENLLGKRINQNGKIVFCKDTSEGFQAGGIYGEDKCDYKLVSRPGKPNLLEGMDLTDDFELIFPDEDTCADDRSVLRRLQAQSRSPIPAPCANQPSKGAGSRDGKANGEMGRVINTCTTGDESVRRTARHLQSIQICGCSTIDVCSFNYKYQGGATTLDGDPNDNRNVTMISSPAPTPSPTIPAAWSKGKGNGKHRKSWDTRQMRIRRRH